MTVNQAISRIEFPIETWEKWNKEWTMWVCGKQKYLRGWSDIYDALEIKNRKKTLLDFHPDYTIDDWRDFVELNLIIGTSADIYKFKEKWDDSLRTLTDINCIRYTDQEVTISIEHVDYSRIKK